jgi:asparaginyl-tRNA synthetase
MKVKDLASKEGEVVQLQGWVANKRESKTVAFVILRDGSGQCQCIIDVEKVGDKVFSNAKSLTLESSLEIEGKVVRDERQIGGFEIHATNMNIIQIAEEYPIAKKEHGVDFLMDKRHLWLRSQRQWAIMRIRNVISFSIHQFFQKEEFVQMDAPLFTGNACEGTTNLFETDYYGQPAYLSQSGQLYGEAMAMAMGKIYTFGPTFRAEKSKTRRHLSEFWMIEPEMAFYDIFQNMDLIEDFLKFVIGAVIAQCKNELEIIDRDIEVLSNSIKGSFKRLTYDEAVEIITGKKEVNGKNTIDTLSEDLKEKEGEKLSIENEIAEREHKIQQPGVKKGERNFNKNKIAQLKNTLKDIEEDLRNIPEWIASAKNFTYGEDFGGSDETVLTRMFKTPIMVYDWPHEVKAFYLKRNPNDERFARGVDVLAPEGYGEIVGGGERETDVEKVTQKIIEHELPMQEFEWYLDLRRFGSVPHSGFGLGLERLVAYVCKLPHVRETIPFPRMYGRLFP